MTLKELMEQAHLDALGLLEGPEAAAFERAFMQAPPAVKAQLRAEQARWASSEALLPEVNPPASLRQRVLEAVRRAMVDSSSSADAEVIELRPSRRVHPVWRAASLGLLAACVLLAAGFFGVKSRYDDMSAAMAQDQLLERMLATMGASYRHDVLFDSTTRRVVFEPQGADASFKAEVAMFTNPRWSNPLLVCANLPLHEGSTYRLVLLDGANKVADELAEFGPSVGGQIVSQKLKTQLSAGMRLALVEAPAGAAAKAEHILMLAVI